jgi:hypothetical protein
VCILYEGIDLLTGLSLAQVAGTDAMVLTMTRFGWRIHDTDCNTTDMLIFLWRRRD